MKFFNLTKTKSSQTIASLCFCDFCKDEIMMAFPVINEWVRDMTNGECYLKLVETGFEIYRREDSNFEVTRVNNTLIISEYHPAYYIVEV